MMLPQSEKLHLRILIVEASEHLRILLSAMVRPIKKEIFFADNPTDGFTLAGIVKPDLIIADYGLDGSGGRLCARIRNDPQLGGTPMVMLSGFGRHVNLAGYHRTGCDEVVYKPFQCMELYAAIQKVLLGHDGAVPRVVPVMYRNGECDLVDTVQLDRLIKAGEIDGFRRRDGLVVIGRDPVRCGEETAEFSGQERRWSTG